MAGLDLDGFAQALRVAHCSRDGAHAKELGCVGVVTIKAGSVELACKLCGNGTETIAPSELLLEVRAAKSIMAALGLDWEAISDMRKRDIVNMVTAWRKDFK